jgi:uncharacterized protein
MTQLFDAIKSGDLAAVTTLLDADSSLANAANEQGMPAHTFAVYNRKNEIARLLEDRGARIDIFAAAMTGRTDLMTTLLSGNKSLAKLVSHDGWTPLHLAAFFGHPEAARTLLQAGAEVNVRSNNQMSNMPLHAAVAGRNAEVIRMLVEHGAAVNAQQHGGWTPLHAAAQNGDAPMVSYLIENGAAVSRRADNNQSPLDLALTSGNQEIVNILEKHGASL